jgi:hypothetical protein
MNTW